MQSKWGRTTSGTLMALAAGFAGLESANTAWADDDARVKELEERLADMERQLGEMQERGGMAAGFSSELEARVAELEKATKVDKGGLFWSWKEGMHASTADGKFKIKFGGRIMDDFVFWSGDDGTTDAFGPLKTGAEFRRARLYVSGDIYENVEFKAQYDFEGGNANFKDMYIAYKTGVGTVTVGNHYVPFGFEEQVSSKYMTFMERGVANTFNPSRQNGISLGDDAGEWNWRFGVFRPSDAFGNDTDNSGDGEWSLFARIAGRPFVDKENEQYLHVGISAGRVRYENQEARYRQRPEVHMSPRFVDTGTFAANEATIWDLEGAFVSGPFHSEIEYSRADVDAIDMSDPSFDAFSISAGMFLTGESRPYKGSFFGRVKPKKNWGDEGGTGAWEVAARYSTIDLSDGDVDGNSMDIVTLGLNWYLNPNTRIMLNVNFIDPDADGADDVHAVALRFQIDF